MNTPIDLERMVAGVLADTAASREPDGLLRSVLFTTGRMRPRPRWLALIKEPPMRVSSRVAVGSPTFRLASMVILTLLLALLATGAVVGGASLLPGTIVVAQDGSGTVKTITEAVAMAQDGDTIIIRPGTYQESVTISADISVRGDGPPGSVIIEFTPDSPTVVSVGYTVPNGLRLEESDAHVSNLSIRGPDAGTAVWVSGGAPTLEGITAELAGEYAGRPHFAIEFTSSTRASMRDSTGVGNLAINDGASPTIERLVSELGGFISGADSRPIIRDSTFGGALDIKLGAEPILEGNDMIGILVNATGTPVVQGNTFHNQDFQPGAAHDSSEEITAIEIIASSPLLIANRIGDHEVGISVGNGSQPTIQDNLIEANTIGVAVSGVNATPVMRDNSFCGNGTNLQVPEGSTLTLDGNTICEDTASPSP